jgi:hypothetical protein
MKYLSSLSVQGYYLSGVKKFCIFLNMSALELTKDVFIGLLLCPRKTVIRSNENRPFVKEGIQNS